MPGPTLVAMKPSGAGIGQATNMREALCTKAGSQALRKREREAAAKLKKEGNPEPATYLAQREGPRELVPITIGTATGPAPAPIAALLAQDAAEKAAQAAEKAKKQAAIAAGFDPAIPLPTWRPDRPTPAGTEPAIGDAEFGEIEAAVEDAEATAPDAETETETATPDPAVVTLDK